LLAAQNGREETVLELLSKGANVEFADGVRSTICGVSAILSAMWNLDQ
jgi:hypothetical protein